MKGVLSNSLYFLILLSFGFIMIGCNITYKVRNQHSEIEQIFHIPCGKVVIELEGKGNSKFKLKQKFDMNEKIYVFKDSLFVYFNGVKVEINHKLNEGKNNSNEVVIEGQNVWEASFDLDKSVFEGDTIIVYGENYIGCFNETITLDTIIYSFVNNLRIKGVNDF